MNDEDEDEVNEDKKRAGLDRLLLLSFSSSSLIPHPLLGF